MTVKTVDLIKAELYEQYPYCDDITFLPVSERVCLATLHFFNDNSVEVKILLTDDGFEFLN